MEQIEERLLYVQFTTRGQGGDCVALGMFKFNYWGSSLIAEKMKFSINDFFSKFDQIAASWNL